jgi:hypothetical protein
MKRAKVKIYLSDNPKEQKITIDGTDITHAVEGFQLLYNGKNYQLAAGIKGDIWGEGRIPTSLRKLIEPVETKPGTPVPAEDKHHDTP